MKRKQKNVFSSQFPLDKKGLDQNSLQNSHLPHSLYSFLSWIVASKALPFKTMSAHLPVLPLAKAIKCTHAWKDTLQ